MRTSRPSGSKAADKARLLVELAEVVERLARSSTKRETERCLREIGSLGERATLAGVSMTRLKEVYSSAYERGQSTPSIPAQPAAQVVPIRATRPPPPARTKATSFEFYPPQPCGKSYEDFKVGFTYKDAYDQVAFGRPQEEGTYRTIGRSTVLRQLASMKRDAYDRYRADCEAQAEYEREQAFGGREGEYADDSGEFDTSFDPSMFAQDDESLMFNPRCPSCGGASHSASGSLLPSGEVVCGPCVRRFWSWASEHGKKTYRVGRKGKGSKYIAFPTGITKKNPRLSVEQVWHRLGSPRVNLSELATGIRIESEHGVGPVKAGRIALDHLREFPDYYTRLVKMEERAKKGLAPNVRVRASYYGHHHGQSDGTLFALDESGQTVGTLDFVVFRGRALIRMVESSRRRAGIGRALVNHLAKEVGGYDKIDWGYMTSEGVALRDALDREHGYDRTETQIDAKRLALDSGGVLLSHEGGRHENTQRLYVEFEDHRNAEAFIAKARALSAHLEDIAEPDVQEDFGKAWVDAEIPVSIPNRILRSRETALAPNPKIVSLGPHAYFAAAGLAMNARWTSRRPRKATSRKNAPR